MLARLPVGRINVIADDEFIINFFMRDVIPRLIPFKATGVHPDYNRGDHRRAAQGDGAGATMETDDIVIARARAFGKNEHGLRALQGADSMVNDLGTAVVGNEGT